MEQNQLSTIVSQFAISGTVSEIRPLGEGLINDTYKVVTAEASEPDYVLQRVNHNVFPDVDMVMRNIEAVTNHIRMKLTEAGEDDIERKVLRFIPAKADGKLYIVQDGQYWRIMVFIPTPSPNKPLIPPLAVMQVEPLDASRLCLPTFPSNWAKPSRTSTTWSSVLSNFVT